MEYIIKMNMYGLYALFAFRVTSGATCRLHCAFVLVVFWQIVFVRADKPQVCAVEIIIGVTLNVDIRNAFEPNKPNAISGESLLIYEMTPRNVRVCVIRPLRYV